MVDAAGDGGPPAAAAPGKSGTVVVVVGDPTHIRQLSRRRRESSIWRSQRVSDAEISTCFCCDTACVLIVNLAAVEKIPLITYKFVGGTNHASLSERTARLVVIFCSSRSIHMGTRMYLNRTQPPFIQRTD